MSADTEWHGEPHTLIVHSVRLPDGPFDDGGLEYDLEHSASCGQEERQYLGVLEYNCDVAANESDIGLASSLRYSGTPITAPGTYRIQGWGTKKYYWDSGYEYDGGVAVMDATDAQVLPSVQSCAQVETGES